MITCHIILFNPNVFVSPERVKPRHLHVESTKHLMQCTLPSFHSRYQIADMPNTFYSVVCVGGGGCHGQFGDT